MGWLDGSKDVKVSELNGKTLMFIGKYEKDELWFVTNMGEKYRMYHEQDCCENVRIDDIVGDLNDLVGSPIIHARCDTNDGSEGYESSTWTFYNFATVKGHVTLKWLGESNGYYSERVDFALMKDGTDLPSNAELFHGKRKPEATQ